MFMMRESSRLRTGFMIGSIIGLCAGMFLATKGKHRIKHIANNIKEEAIESWEKIEEKMHKRTDGMFEDVMDDAKHFVEDVKEDMEIGEIGKEMHKMQKKSYTSQNGKMMI